MSTVKSASMSTSTSTSANVAAANATNAANKLEALVESFISKLRRRQITGSYNVAIATCQFLMRVTSISRWNTAIEFLTLIRGIGKKVTEAQPREFAAGNIVRRVLAIIRDETNMKSNDASAGVSTSMFQLLTPKTIVDNNNNNNNNNNNSTKLNEKSDRSDLRSLIIQGIRDLMDEIQSVHENIELMTVDLIHDNEILLTPTPGSSTVLNFLLKASLKRKFTVLITENYPNDIKICHKFAKKLADANIESVIIPDSSVFAVMSRVGKVLIGTRSVFANGGSVTAAGVATVCECAKEHRTPVFAVAGLYKFSPCYPFDRNSLIEVGNSGKVLPYDDSALVGKCEVTNPLYDYVVPEHIDIYITNIGGFSPNFIYRIVLDNYSTDDVDLS
jgi:translation initiation factor eIF-2B subunit beta